MFKNVEYTGFEEYPELKTRAEQLTAVLAGEISTWRDEVDVRWSPHAEAEGLDLSLTLTLLDEVTVTRTGRVPASDFGHPSRVASRCGRVWYDLLGDLLERIHTRVEESLLEPTEA